VTAAVLLGRGRGREQQEGEEVWPELEERGRGRPCRWWLRAPRRRRAFEGGHTEDAIGRLRVGRASGTSERQGESRYMPSEERVWPARGRTRVELGSRRIPCVALPLLTRSSDGWVANCVRRPPPAEPGCWAQAEGKKVKVGSGAGRCLGNPADSDRGARREMAGHSECLARSGGRAVGAQLKNGEETVVTNDVHVAVRERHIPLWIGSGGGRRRAQDATGVVYL